MMIFLRQIFAKKLLAMLTVWVETPRVVKRVDIGRGAILDPLLKRCPSVDFVEVRVVALKCPLGLNVAGKKVAELFGKDIVVGD